jgi:hypothetical protein
LSGSEVQSGKTVHGFLGKKKKQMKKKGGLETGKN